MKTYFVTSGLRRTSMIWPDAYEVVKTVNKRAGDQGVAQDRDAVQALLDDLADAETQALMEITITEKEAVIDG
jgi:hypothetical protein